MDLIFDTETTGLPNRALQYADPQQPHIVELAALVIDPTLGKVVLSMHTLVRPDEWEIPLRSTEIHGITQKRAMVEGRPEPEVLSDFLSLFFRYDIGRLVAHNLAFDRNMLMIGFSRYFGPLAVDILHAPEHFCTMEYANKHCKLPPTAKQVAAGFTHYKNPTLKEAVERLVGLPFGGYHNALDDTRSCLALYLWLLDNDPEFAPDAVAR